MPRDVTILSLVEREPWVEAEVGLTAPSQCWRFAAALNKSGYEPRLAIVEAEGSRMLLPFIERTDLGHTGIATLPGLSGASIIPASSAPLALWREFAASRKWVTGYIQLSAESFPNLTPDTTVEHRGHMFLIDPVEWDLNRTPSRIIQRKVNAATRAGAAISDDRLLLAAALPQLYSETLSRFGAKSRFSTATLDEWAHDARNLLLGITLFGHAEAIHLVHIHHDLAEIHLVVSSARARDWSALLYAATLERLKTMNIRRCNLGGGGNPGDGLYTFKSWLGGRPVPLQAIRDVYDPGRFAHLCIAAGVRPDAAWFPPYASSSPTHANG